MNTSSTPIIDNGALNSASACPAKESLSPTDWPVAVLGLMMFLVPAIGVTNELMLQDTLKSAMVAFGVLIAAMLFFWQQRQRTTPLLWHGLVCLPLVLMVYALASMAWSHTYLAGVEAIRWFILSLLLWLGLNTLTRNNLPTLVWGIHGGAVVASLWAALQFWLDLGLFPQGPNPASTFINRNFFAEYAVCVLPFSIYALANMRASRWLIWHSLSVALIVVAIMMTGTRSALIAMVVLAPVFMVILLKYWQQFAFASWSRFNKIGVGLILAAGVLGMGSMPSGNVKIIGEKIGSTALQRSYLRAASIGEAKEFTEGSFSIRAVMWKATARMMMANPLTGVGAGAWEVQIPLYQRADEPMETDYYAHNEFLQLLSEYGVLVGGLVVAFLWAYWLKAAGTTWRLRGTNQEEEVALRALTLASLLALMIVSNAGFPWHLAGCGTLLALGLAILAGSDARLRQRTSLNATPMRWKPIYAPVALVVGGTCTVVAIYVTWQAALVEYKLMHAIKLATRLAQSRPADTQAASNQKAELLQDVRDGIAISPHYRKLTPMVADLLAAGGDLTNAVWIWESVLVSRPHIAVFWSNLALAYSKQGQLDRAQEALQQVQRIKPEAIATRTLEIILLSRSGHEAQAAQRLTTQYDQGLYDYDMLQAGYRIGFHAGNWPLAIRSLELRNATWPDQTADGYFRLGNIYAAPSLKDDTKALAAYKSGLSAVPAEQKENFRSQVPARYRSLM